MKGPILFIQKSTIMITFKWLLKRLKLHLLLGAVEVQEELVHQVLVVVLEQRALVEPLVALVLVVQQEVLMVHQALVVLQVLLE
jgi:hypothetical protein